MVRCVIPSEFILLNISTIHARACHKGSSQRKKKQKKKEKKSEKTSAALFAFPARIYFIIR